MVERVTAPSGARAFIDLHCHTNASFDSLASPGSVVRAAAQRGLTHLAITDHGRIAGALACRVGGGIRTVARARHVLAAGARQVIVGSSLFKGGRPDLEFATALRDAVGRDKVIGAVDSRGGHIVVHGWKTALPLTAVEAVQALEPYCDEFLYTHVDTEGLMTGTSIDAILAVRAATSRRLTAAGGITTRAEIDALHASGIDAVVGMAIYTGALDLDVRDQV